MAPGIVLFLTDVVVDARSSVFASHSGLTGRSPGSVGLGSVDVVDVVSPVSPPRVPLGSAPSAPEAATIAPVASAAVQTTATAAERLRGRLGHRLQPLILPPLWVLYGRARPERTIERRGNIHLPDLFGRDYGEGLLSTVRNVAPVPRNRHPGRPLRRRSRSVALRSGATELAGNPSYARVSRQLAGVARGPSPTCPF